MRTNVKLKLTRPVAADSAKYLSDAEVELMCLRFGSTTGTLEGIADWGDREECAEWTKRRIEDRKKREAYLYTHRGSTDGTVDGIENEGERERVIKKFKEEQDRWRADAEMQLKFERRRVERRKQAEERKAQEQARAERFRQRLARTATQEPGEDNTT